MAKIIHCNGCDKDRSEKDYYKSYGTTVSGLLPLCKHCCTHKGLDRNGKIDLEKFKQLLMQVDRPYIHSLFVANINKYEKVTSAIGYYFKDLGMVQNRGLRWKDSVFKQEDNCNEYSFGDVEKDLLRDFKPTKDMLIRWGTKYSAEQYIKLENFYNEMMEKNTIETPQEIDYLKKLAVISMKMDEELENGNYGQVKQLGDLFSKYMADSKFRAMDKTEADKTGGVRNFSTIYAEVESDDFIPPWEYYRKIKGLKQDIVDKVIMHMENFTLRLNRVEKMTEPPMDTPILTQEETNIDLGDING